MTTVTTQSLLSVQGVTFGYHRQAPVLRDVTAELHAGRVTVLLGPNATGKSTLLKIMLGLENPWQGKVLPDDPQEQLRLAFVTLAVLVVGQQLNALLGYLAARLRRRRLARDMELDGSGGAARTAVRSWVRPRSLCQRLSP